MARDILSAPEKAALVAAVKDVERRSTAEVVIAFRGRSGAYLDADLTAGALFAVFTLWFQLFTPWEYCEFCGALVSSGDFDWVLSRIEQDDSYSG